MVEQQRKNPFLIRGHHLEGLSFASNAFSRVVSSAEEKGVSRENIIPSGERVARRMVRDLRWAQITRNLPQLFHRNRIIVGSSSKAEYADDTIGKTRQTRRRFKENTKQFLEDFLSLPDDAPILLTNVPDGFCAGCAFGKHCQTGSYKVYDFNAIMGFKEFIERDTELTPLFSINTPKVGFLDVTISASAGSLRKALSKLQ